VGCSSNEVRVIVPWNAQTGDVVAFADGASSNGVHLQILPFEAGPSAGIVPGSINVQMAPGVDIAVVLQREGEPLGAATPLFDSDDPLLVDWYSVTVPAGQEIAKCRAYARHPEVLEVGPVVFVGVDDPTPTSPRMPGALPPSGARPYRGAAAGGLLLAALGTLAIVAAGLISLQSIRTPSGAHTDRDD
jgi:hypothetical protein